MSEVTPGTQTSEYAITKLQIIIGAVLTIVGAAIEVLQQLQLILPSATWIGVAIMALGVIVKIAATLGYQRSRATVKAAAASAPAAPAPAPAPAAPMVVQVHGGTAEVAPRRTV